MLCILLLHVIFKIEDDKIQSMTEKMTWESVITCPSCGHQHAEQMPRYAVKAIYECVQCKTVLTTKEGECCIYCVYGSVPCPSKQREKEK